MTTAGALTAQKSVEELESLARFWMAMGEATTLDEIERAALLGLSRLTQAEIAYTSRRENGVWTISDHVGLVGNVSGISVPEEFVPYAEALRTGQTICYEGPASMGAELSATLAKIGLGSLYAVPIMAGDECVGALAIGNRQVSGFSARQRVLTQLFTTHLSTLVRKRELVQSLETLAENVPVIVLRTDPSGWINWYNRRWYEFTGQTREEAAGWGWQTAHHPDDFLRVMEEWPKALATGKPIEIEFRLRRYDGAYHWHLAVVEPVRDDKGNIISWYGSVVDIEAQKQAHERTKRVAEALQEAFLPASLPSRPNLRLDATYVAAEADAHVGGDWYDAFELPDGRLVFSIGDVAGHGLSASIAAGRVRQAVFTLARLIDNPSLILAEVNTILREQEPGMFVTAILGVVDSAGSTIQYAVAGHPPPVVAYRQGSAAVELATDGPPLGVAEKLELAVHSIEIESNMVFALYTDGMTEYGRDAVAGEIKLQSAVSALVGNTSLAHPAKFVYDATLEGHRPQDDAALLLLQFSHTDVTRETPRQPSAVKEWRFHASDAKAAHVARREIGAFLQRTCGNGDATFDSELIIGELLANTVEHAPGLVHLIIEWTGTEHVLIVRDSGPGLERFAAALPSDVMQEGNRGLFLVAALSAGVSVVESPAGGAELRVVLPLR